MSFWLFTLSAILAMVVLMPLNYFVSLLIGVANGSRELRIATRKYGCSTGSTAKWDAWRYRSFRPLLNNATRQPYPVGVHDGHPLRPADFINYQPDIHISLHRPHPDFPSSEFPPIRPIPPIVRPTPHPLGLIPHSPGHRGAQTPEGR